MILKLWSDARRTGLMVDDAEVDLSVKYSIDHVVISIHGVGVDDATVHRPIIVVYY